MSTEHERALALLRGVETFLRDVHDDGKGGEQAFGKAAEDIAAAIALLERDAVTP